MVNRLPMATAVTVVLLSAVGFPGVARADDEFPYGFEMTLDADRMPGSKRIPSLEIGENGEVVLELWCKAGKGQFSVAGDTILFIPGVVETRNCPAERAQADDDLLATLGSLVNWKRQGDLVTLTGARTLRFRINTN